MCWDRVAAITVVAAVAAAAWPLAAEAQDAPPAGSPSDIRYTPAIGSPSALYPKTPDIDAKPALTTSDDASLGAGGVDFGVNAAVGRIVVEVDRDAVPADGQSPVKIVVRLFDKNGAPLRSPAFVTIEHSGGRVLLAGARTDEFGPRRQDADRTVPGVQLKVHNGLAQFTLLAPFEAQDVRLRVSAGAEEAAGSISFIPELRPMVATGLVEGIVNFRHRTVLDPVRQGDAFEQEIESWSRQFNGGKANVAARAAFFLKGTIRGDALLTAAYDSDKDTRTRLLRDIRPDELYPVYGDSSLRSFDARSASRAYVRLDHNKDYILYGDFVTGDGFTQPIGQGAVATLKQRSLGNYNRTATGVRAHKEDDRLTASTFAFYDSLRQIVEEFASQGSGPYGLRNNAVLEGSDKVEIIVRDRFNTSRIVSVKPLVRLVDYSFEPFSGRIVLATFMPSVDENLNPVSLRVTYEVDQGGERFWVYGADGQFKLSPQFELGGSIVDDTNPLAHYRLGSANATWKIGEHTALVAEVARTQTEINTNPTNQST
ncbi:MAG: Ig-like domain-containing protein, partial [Actinomycetota bacterium]|nr:Ig-like domain-containing protein [Actinomycetota bacterium]